MVGADYIHGRGKVLAPQDDITRAEFAQIFANIISSYITVKGTYDKDIKGSVLIRTDEVTLQNMTVDGDLIIGCGAADGKITLDNVTVKGRLLVWGGGTKAVYCNAGTNMPAVVVARVDDAVKVIYDRDSTLAVIDTIKMCIRDRIGDVRVQDCLIDNVHAPNCPALNRMIGTMANVDELDWLGKQLESFDRYELLQFNAAVERFGLSACLLYTSRCV